jgi:outer membrane protease
MSGSRRLLLLLSVVLASHLTGGEPRLVDAMNVIVEPTSKKSLLTFGVGHLQASANEVVYGGPGPGDGKLSELNWKTEHAVTLQIGVTRNLLPRIDLFANGTYGYEANSDMVDTDWLGFDANWTDRSRHPDTSLEHYFQGEVGLSWLAWDRGPWQLFLRGGFRYTDIAWAAHGGSYVYSTFPPFTFRDQQGDFPNGALGIAYRQKIPGVFLGPQFSCALGRLTLRGGGLAGMSISPSDRDRHWAAGSIFVEEFDQQVFFGGNVGLDYKLENALTLFFEGVYDKFPLMKGSSQFTDLATGETQLEGGAAAGASLETWQIRGGVRLPF